MSHFTVLVIGDNYESQLAPFQENNIGDPGSKWDWYSLGGRWTGFFKLKRGRPGLLGDPGLRTEPADSGRADQARLEDIDIEGMMAEEDAKARAQYGRLKRLMGGSIPEVEKPWSQFLKERGEVSIDVVREQYWAQPSMLALKKAREQKLGQDDAAFLGSFYFDLEAYSGGEEAYAQRARNSVLTTFAVLKDGKWYERGEMGWWGCASNEKDESEWGREVAELIRGLPGNTLLTLVDCHI